MTPTETDRRWYPYQERFSKGEWRAPIFKDLILADVERLERKHGKLSLLDIGCGGGFDADPELQRLLARSAGEYIGVEPDPEMELQDIFSATHRCGFEDAPIPSDSVDIAFAVMVLEHFEHPRLFWDQVHRVLKDGGVFWGFTVDARHWFAHASMLTETLGIKDWYLNRLHGRPGEEGYENYGVFYRNNTPKDLQKYTHAFRSSEILGFQRVGQMDYYFPRRLRWVGRTLDRIVIGLGGPGSLLAVRVEK